MSVDVAVVGCGIIGAAVAWRLSRLGLTVACLDPAPGDGATHAAAGMLADVTEADFGEDHLTALNVASARAWPEFAAELSDATGADLAFRRTGTLTVAYDSGDRQQLRRLLTLRRGLGLPVEEIAVDDARRMEPLLGPRLAGATWTADEHQVDPRRVHAALLAVLADRGVAVVRRRVTELSLTPSGEVGGVVDDRGTRHRAGSVVLAAGWASRELARALPGLAGVPTRPVKGQILRLDASGQPGFTLGRVVRGFVQARAVYLVPRPGGEVVVGATSEEQPDDRQVTAGGTFAVLRDARALVPGIDELPLTELTARARPGSPDNLPLIGDSGIPGLLLATGHYRNGILLAPLTASALAARYGAGTVPEWAAAADPRRFAATVTGGPT
ncbi:glycine oxidase ThiO [Jiangella sp. DSM 45060]|uniref:glycine oxidase ThiO n=1 Tax=Jiangella sp. DSM 45060 TaxID=1798224 RepID=UPI000879BCAB|nr:glycine oxidase ThiO [Jiangella sp. DSM 45060]SDT67562.1 glycine oxidase [Jiangella sp. DSM 45060]